MAFLPGNILGERSQEVMKTVMTLPASDTNPLEPQVIANRILSDHKLDQAVTTIPIVDLCKAEGIEVFTMEFQDNYYSGAIVGQKGIYTIYVNQHEPATRQRFTIAHELGHYFLHLQGHTELGDMSIVDDKNVEALVRKPGAFHAEEVRTNEFAAAILMPEKTVCQLSAALSIESLAYLFGVSKPTMTLRVNDIQHRRDSRHRSHPRIRGNAHDPSLKRGVFR